MLHWNVVAIHSLLFRSLALLLHFRVTGNERMFIFLKQRDFIDLPMMDKMLNCRAPTTHHCTVNLSLDVLPPSRVSPFINRYSSGNKDQFRPRYRRPVFYAIEREMWVCFLAFSLCPELHRLPFSVDSLVDNIMPSFEPANRCRIVLPI